MMKNDIEDLMKKALDGMEMPYDQSSWESLQKKLDAKKTPKSYRFWIAGAAAFLVIATLTIIALNKKTKEPTSKESAQNSNESNLVERNDENTKLKLDSKKKLTDLSKDNEQFPSEINEDGTISESFDNNMSNVQNSGNNENQNSDLEKSQNEIASNKIQTQDNNQNNSIQLVEPNFPSFGNKCKNESITINNTNENSIALKTPSGRIIEIARKERIEIQVKETGSHSIGYVESNGQFKEVNSFKVNNLPVLNLTIDEALSYENGLPIIKAEANTNEENISWKVGNSESTAKGKINDFMFFNKGNFNISIKASNEFGCETSETKSIKINEDYKLLAVNAFNPNSTDIRNNTFIPYALTVRNTPFKMVILDPDNGGIIFETSDASIAWDGIDRRDGKLVAPNKAFVWKVSLSHPQLNEKPEYKGTIIRVL
jgi:hypothetical protein